ncbi:M4 family metallopeptidase [Kitasatospora sp. GP82]|uniref:M4 family metallopeptidase n=1 Tax=Kitasatospora sp. GP82 TaxID=3035089 RepID=UPI0024735693|nr:M4 family metallopeptidase [Kitasatospora sp. GP82]MDH6128009.1 Zn-dependent metalloprotease [Kitasatospora sp. GP82]
MKRKLRVGAVLSASAILAGAIQVGTGTAQALSAPAGDAVATQQPAELIALADTQASAAAKALGLGSQEKLVAKDAVVDADGTRHLRYERTLGGLPVIGGDLVVHQDAKGNITSVDRALDGKLALASLTPKLSAGQSAAKATGAVKATVGIAEDEDSAALKEIGSTGSPALVVWATSGTPRLAYRTTVEGVRTDGTPSRQQLVTDATTGEVLSTHEEIQTAGAAGTGRGISDGTVRLTTTPYKTWFQLKDPTRGNQYTTTLKNGTSGKGTLFIDTDNRWGTGQVSNSQSAAVDAQYGAAATWDFYKKTFGRSGIRNDGVGAFSRVHYGQNYINAFWDDSCFCMTYGDGAGNTHPLTALDVAGHEMTHGVTSHTAGLNYSGESGGLNEATSDIMGTGVEWFANLPANPPNYLIGEKINIFGNGAPLRYLDKPSKDGRSADYWSPSVGNLDVHYSSGVANHFFYLLSEGSGAKTINGVSYNSPTYNGAAVAGIGRDKALKIWYRALTTYFTSTTDYKAARVATLKAAADLYGGTGSTEYKQVAAVWTAVNVG